MEWMKIASAVLLVMMIIVLYPSAKHWMKNSPEADSRQWMAALIPIAIVGLFVAFLVSMV